MPLIFAQLPSFTTVLALQQIDVAAVLLGSGVRLFDHLAGMPAFLGDPKVVAGVGVTHLRYPVRKA